MTLATTPTSTATQDPLICRRAIEALRSGVPSLAAISTLHSLQPEIDSHFDDLCRQVRDLPRGGRPAKGLLLGGGFGTGKSHLLSQLRARAESQGFVTSAVTISKEVPLHDIVRVGKAVIAGASLDGSPRDVIERLADGIAINSPGWGEITRDTHHANNRLDPRFAASVVLWDRPGTPADLNDHLMRFWAGEPLHLPTIRKALKSINRAIDYSFDRINDRDLWAQRLGFIARLARAAGQPGWIVTFDEAELIGRYPARQRLRSYAELGRWLQRRPADPTAPLGAVCAITDDYEAAILDHKGDRNLYMRLPYRLDDERTASAAEIGIHAIQRDVQTLRGPTPEDLETIRTRIRTMHGAAYNWEPPPAPGPPARTSNRLRHHIRAWINQWDLYRQHPQLQQEEGLRQVV
jgi:hypothetical protein